MATEFISNSWLMPTNENAEANRVSNYSLDFDGTQDVDCGNDSIFNNAFTGNAFSFSVWVKSSSNVAYDGIVCFGTRVQSFLNSNKIKIWLQGSSGFIVNSFTSNTTILSDTWYHIVFTKNGNDNTLYINGVSDNTVTSSGNVASTTSNLRIGSYVGTQYFWDGSLTEVSIFDYALSTSQVTELYGTGSAIGNPMAITNGRKPVAYYPLGNSVFNSEFLVPNSAEQDFVFSFDGTNDFINTGSGVGNSFGENYTGAITMSIWFKSNVTSSDDGIFQFEGSTSLGEISAAIYANDLEIRVKGGLEVSGSFTNTSNWHHLVISLVSPTGANQVYLDGVPFGSTFTYSSGGLDLNGEDFIIGHYGGSRYFNGLLSNTAIFNTALPATGTESVESLYNYGTPPNIASYSNLQGWWELDASATFDGSNWSIPDASSNSNTGTSSGMTASSLTQSDLIIKQSYDPFSLSFDGVDERISFTETNLGLNNSISIWFKRPSTGYNVLIGQGSAWYDYAVRIESNGSIKYADRYTSPTITFDNASTKSIINTVNTWINIVIVRTGSTANLYVNGVDYDGSKSWGSGNEEGTVFNRLATAGDGTSYAFNGQLSNFASWNTSLTSAQALEVYNEAKPSNLNTHSASLSLVSWYRLGAVNTFYNSTTTEFTVLDEVGTNNGTSVNMEQSDLVSGVGATGSGTSSGMSSGTNRTGNAPYSENNAVSYNMSVTAKSSSTPT